MPLQLRHRSLYAAFDRFPSRKGAAIHIYHMARTLFDSFGGGLLYVLGDETLPVYQREANVEILRYTKPSQNYLERAIGYTRRLGALLDRHGDSLEVCHFRDPWGGVPILKRRDRGYACIFEVNGLPSIELPYLYPRVAPRTLGKIRAAEEFCLAESDVIITPSRALRDNLIALGASANSIVVIANGADIPGPAPRPPAAPARYIIYFGALQRWQGVDVLLRALARLADLDDLYLVVCASGRPRHAKPYRKLAEKLGVAGRVLWLFQLSEDELAPWRSNALISIAPLTECSRNLDQGCCPLKILESMASGVAVIASDLASVREIITDGVDGRLVRPDRPSDLAMAIRVLLEYPEHLRQLGERARQKIERDFTWGRAKKDLASLYRSISSRHAGIAFEEVRL